MSDQRRKLRRFVCSVPEQKPSVVTNRFHLRSGNPKSCLNINDLPVEILEKIFHSLSVQDLIMAVLVCKMWRNVGDNLLWSQITIRVDERNKSKLSKILKSRRTVAVRKIVIGCDVSLSKNGWMSVLKHPGLKQLEVRRGGMDGVEPGLVAKVVTNIETVYVTYARLTVWQVKAILRAVCDEPSIKLKVLDLSWNESVGRLHTGLLARAVANLENVYVADKDLTEEQKSAVQEAAERSSCRVIGLGSNFGTHFDNVYGRLFEIGYNVIYFDPEGSGIFFTETISRCEN